MTTDTQAETETNLFSQEHIVRCGLMTKVQYKTAVITESDADYQTTTLLFTIYINNVGLSMNNKNWGLHLFVDDTVIYYHDPSVQQVLHDLQLGFYSIQESLTDLKLVINIDKTKFMFFSGSRTMYPKDLRICTLRRVQIELVPHYTYMYIGICFYCPFECNIIY
jgi:hypothetical protein